MQNYCVCNRKLIMTTTIRRDAMRCDATRLFHTQKISVNSPAFETKDGGNKRRNNLTYERVSERTYEWLTIAKTDKRADTSVSLRFEHPKIENRNTESTHKKINNARKNGKNAVAKLTALLFSVSRVRVVSVVVVVAIVIVVVGACIHV